MGKKNNKLRAYLMSNDNLKRDYPDEPECHIIYGYTARKVLVGFHHILVYGDNSFIECKVRRFPKADKYIDINADKPYKLKSIGNERPWYEMGFYCGDSFNMKLCDFCEKYEYEEIPESKVYKAFYDPENKFSYDIVCKACMGMNVFDHKYYKKEEY